MKIQQIKVHINSSQQYEDGYDWIRSFLWQASDDLQYLVSDYSFSNWLY